MLKYNSFVNEEVGIRNLKAIIGTLRTCEIYFHKDLDGVTSALAMKQFLKTYYQVETVEAHQIQYGGMEFAIKNHKEGNLCVLVDFAHGKPMFHIQSDHHDSQVGAEDTKATYFKSARSNVEIISGEISYSDMFNPGDVELIKTVDSANFLKHNLTPSDIQNSIFKFNRELDGEKNRFMMGLVVNRLLLAHKNKRITVKSMDGKRDHINKNILECMVLDCNPSLYSMFNNLRHYINNARTNDKAGVLAKPEEIAANLADYIQRMKSYKFIETGEGDVQEYDPTNWRHQQILKSGAKISKGVHFDEEYKIIMQYGAGAMFKPGSYDRYVAFENNPEANFNCIVWPMGLIQVSCNPFRKKLLEKINLGEIAKEVLAKHQPIFSKILVSLDSLKKEFETSQDWKKMQKEEGIGYQGVGFKYADLKAFYIDCIYKSKDGEVKNSIDKLTEISVISVDEIFQNIKIVIDVNGRKYIFSIGEIQEVKRFIVCLRDGHNLEKFSNRIGQQINSFNSDVSRKQVQSANEKIKNLLESDGFIVTIRDNVKVFRKMEDENRLKNVMNKTYEKLTYDDRAILEEYKIPVWELITRNSGGHPSITNIQGFGFLKYNKDATAIAYSTDKYTEVMKKIAREFVNNLKEKIDAIKKGQKVSYQTGGVEFTGQDTNESFTYYLVDKSGDNQKVTKEEFIKAGSHKAMKTDKRSGMTIDYNSKKIIAKFENFLNKK